MANFLSVKPNWDLSTATDFIYLREVMSLTNWQKKQGTWEYEMCVNIIDTPIDLNHLAVASLSGQIGQH